MKEKLPLINSSYKGARIVGYVFFVFIFLMIMGMIFPEKDQTTTDETDFKETANVLSHYGFGDYTFDDQVDVKASVKNGTDVVHMMDMSELPIDYGHTKDGASYTVTSTGKHCELPRP